MKTALLLSGGMDSTAIAYWKRPAIAITVNYGQLSAAGEERASAAVCHALGIDHRIVSIDLAEFGSGDMAGRPQLAVSPLTEWWPFRNQMLITVAAMATLRDGVSELMIGSLRSDAGHVDGTSEFIDAANQLLSIQEGSMKLSAPAIGLTATELLESSKVPMSVLAWSHSCHSSDYACGECGGCRKHYRTMEAVGVVPY